MVSQYHRLLTGRGSSGETADSRAGAGIVQSEPGASISSCQMAGEFSKMTRVLPKDASAHSNRLPPGQRWAPSNIPKDTNRSELKHIKCISIHKFIGTFKKRETNETLKTHKNALVPSEGCQALQFITLKTGQYRESQTCTALFLYARMSGWPPGRWGEVSFKEVLQLVNEDGLIDYPRFSLQRGHHQ